MGSIFETGNPAVDAAVAEYVQGPDEWLLLLSLCGLAEPVRCAWLESSPGCLKVRVWNDQDGPDEDLVATFFRASDIMSVSIEK